MEFNAPKSPHGRHSTAFALGTICAGDAQLLSEARLMPCYSIFWNSACAVFFALVGCQSSEFACLRGALRADVGSNVVLSRGANAGRRGLLLELQQQVPESAVRGHRLPVVPLVQHFVVTTNHGRPRKSGYNLYSCKKSSPMIGQGTSVPTKPH